MRVALEHCREMVSLLLDGPPQPPGDVLVPLDGSLHGLYVVKLLNRANLWGVGFRLRVRVRVRG